MVVSTATLCTANFKREVEGGRSIPGLFPPTDEANRTEFAA
jgi:hypothetical protein